MSLLIDTFIKSNFSPEMVKLLQENLTLIDQLIVYKDFLNYEELIQDGYQTPETRSDNFLALLDRDNNFIIDNHYILLINDVPLKIKVALLSFFLKIQNEEVDDQLLTILENDENNNITLGHLVSYYTEIDLNEFLEYIDSVDDYFINNLNVYLNQKDEIENKLSDIGQSKIDRVHDRLTTLSKETESLKYHPAALSLLKLNVPYFQTPLWYLERLEDYFNQILNEKDHQRVSVDLTSIIILSDNPNENLLSDLDLIIEHLFDSPISGKSVKDRIIHLLST